MVCNQIWATVHIISLVLIETIWRVCRHRCYRLANGEVVCRSLLKLLLRHLILLFHPLESFYFFIILRKVYDNVLFLAECGGWPDEFLELLIHFSLEFLQRGQPRWAKFTDLVTLLRQLDVGPMLFLEMYAKSFLGLELFGHCGSLAVERPIVDFSILSSHV